MLEVRPRIAVVGIGAIGGCVAADLSDLGRHEVVLCARTPFERLVVEHPAGTTRSAASVNTEPAGVKPVDWVLLATKAYQTEGAARWLAALCAPGTRVAVLQNGVDHVERVAPLLPRPAPIVPVVVQLPAEKLAPGRVSQGHAGALIVPNDDHGREFAQLFQGARVRVAVVPDFGVHAWRKLLMNAALGGVCALALRENGAAADPELHQLILALMREILPVARAAGAELPDDAPEQALALALGAASDHWSSIAVDRRERRPMEWEVRNAVVGRIAARHGIDTPLNDAVAVMLRMADVSASAT